MKQIKLTYDTVDYKWVYVEICQSKAGVMSAYLHGNKMVGLPIVKGYGYNKIGVLLSKALNYLVNKDISTNIGEGEFHTTEQARKYGIEIKCFCSTKSGTLYKFTNLNAEGV
jgi:hypothetical protein